MNIQHFSTHIFTLRPMDATSAAEIATWQYVEPYTMYSFDLTEQAENIAWLLDSTNQYYTVWNNEHTLVGFRCFGADAQVPGGDYSLAALDMGGGLHPAWTSRGLGVAVMQAAFAYACEHFKPQRFRVSVAAFNQRAMRACQKAGYRPLSSFEHATTKKPFVMLIRDASCP